MKKSIFRTVLVPTAIVGAFGGGLLAGQVQADQPYMHHALDQLMGARATLADGAPDKGGHRVRAIAFVDRAIGEVRMGIQYAR